MMHPDVKHEVLLSMMEEKRQRMLETLPLAQARANAKRQRRLAWRRWIMSLRSRKAEPAPSVRTRFGH